MEYNTVKDCVLSHKYSTSLSYNCCLERAFYIRFKYYHSLLYYLRAFSLRIDSNSKAPCGTFTFFQLKSWYL